MSLDSSKFFEICEDARQHTALQEEFTAYGYSFSRDVFHLHNKALWVKIDKFGRMETGEMDGYAKPMFSAAALNALAYLCAKIERAGRNEGGAA